jgi:dsRNA-specific ribonuclease
MKDKAQNIMKMERILGYSFLNKDLLNRALTRKAYALEQKQRNEPCEDQEIFRTLGDAILKAILVDLLIQSGCKTRDGITRKKAKLEREEGLTRISRELGIGPFIELGIGEKKQEAHDEPKVLAETLEAIVGSIYLDGGFDVSHQTVRKWFKRSFPHGKAPRTSSQEQGPSITPRRKFPRLFQRSSSRRTTT